MTLNRRLMLMLAFFFLAHALSAADGPDRAYRTGAPSIAVLKNQRMLVVTMMGDPDKVAPSALNVLYRHFFAAATDSEKNAAIAPRVRWSDPAFAADGKDRIGKYALPVSRDFPDIREPGVTVEEWRYGLTAEIMHYGDYASEPASMEILKAYLSERGLSVIGGFEEEYVQGRGTFYRGDPGGYATRLRVRIAAIRDELPPDAPVALRPAGTKAGEPGE
jgi:hypothetical protein